MDNGTTNLSPDKGKNIFKIMFHRFFEHSLTRLSGQLAFFILLSLFPFLLFLNALIGSFDIHVNQLIALLTPIFPDQIVGLIVGYIEQVSQNQSVGLLSVAIIVAIFSASSAVRSLSFAINTAYGIKERDNILRNIVSSMLYVIAAGVIAVMVIVFVALSREFLYDVVQISNVSSFYINLLSTMRWVALVAILFFILALVYRIMPNKKVHFTGILPGTFFSTIGLIALTYGFSLYVSYFLIDSIFNGTIGAVILLMLWVYLASMIITLGAELNSVLEEKSEKRQHITGVGN